MFIILYGITGKIGDLSRAYFEDIGFRRLKKTYYSTSAEERRRLAEEEHNPVVSTREEITDRFDFSYSINRRTMGFNKSDFNRAVQGDEDLYTSIACLDIEFLKTLKAEYGKYVTVVYVYTDDFTLAETVKKYSEEERPERLETSRKLKNVYLQNITLFDHVAIYGGENSVFNAQNLFKQLKEITEKAKNNEVMLNSQRKVQLPYVGAEDFIFVSYSHDDRKKVEEILHLLQRNGFRVWYDSGIKGGENWKKVLREKIRCCTDFILFTSENAVQSEDVKIEIVTADIYERKIVRIMLDDANFTGTVESILHNLHAVDYTQPEFEETLVAALDERTRVQNDNDTQQ